MWRRFRSGRKRYSCRAGGGGRGVGTVPGSQAREVVRCGGGAQTADREAGPPGSSEEWPRGWGRSGAGGSAGRPGGARKQLPPAGSTAGNSCQEGAPSTLPGLGLPLTPALCPRPREPGTPAGHGQGHWSPGPAFAGIQQASQELSLEEEILETCGGCFLYQLSRVSRG